MPNKDGTGPNGQGALTGRGFGNCEDVEMRKGFRRGNLLCPRFGLGQREVTLSNEQEKKVLEAQLAELEAEKTEVEKRLKEL